MKQAGRISFVLLAVIVAILVAGGVLVVMLAGEAPESVATQWMRALKRGDVDTLTKLSYMGSEPPAEVAKKWDFTVHTVNPYYQFMYGITGSKQLDQETASVQIE